ncbi:hypothetical protein BLA60_34365 [Actinophytocola xinjiangensis]|uniref:Pyridoxamine 5'-phosphate oxidase N-terminal domain-containing protein n=1 Tax=Actinophytocola xinjiangensis TaxID=485602 RepID=A0A7Z1AUC4_9PSEU|nr:pyridoxamine 5'-phosphate oxidase family protein [Actinophytocola xinjiangensis]OLF05867.1 hypothetical protein BLA60_34365 [Actinophytocola xinjiangensis]
MWDTVPRLLAEHRYLVLGTAGPAGDPWVTPVFYAPDGTHRVVWVSAPDSRHSRNIAARPTVSVTIFDTNAPVGGAEALYLEARAGLVDEHDRPAAVGLLDARLPAGRRLEPEDLGPAGPLWVYQAIVTRHHVLVRGGDPRFDNVTDARLVVEPPA